MNKDITKSLKLVKDDIYDEPCVQKYLRLKNLIDKSSRLNKLYMQIKYLQKCDCNIEEKKKYYSLLKEYNEDPLIIEFNNISEQVYNLLNEIKEEIESW